MKVTDRHHVQAFKRSQSLKAYQNVLDLSKVSPLFDKRVQSSHKNSVRYHKPEESYQLQIDHADFLEIRSQP